MSTFQSYLRLFFIVAFEGKFIKCTLTATGYLLKLTKNIKFLLKTQLLKFEKSLQFYYLKKLVNL